MSLLLGPLGIQIKSTDLVLNAPQNAVPPVVVEPRGTDYESPAPPILDVFITASWTEEDDVTAIVAVTSGGAVTAALAWTEDADVAAIAVAVAQAATLTWTEADDVVVLAALVKQFATLAWTEADDVSAVAAEANAAIALAWTESDDVTAIVGTVGSVTVTADLAWVEDADVTAIIASEESASVSPSSGIGGGTTGHPEQRKKKWAHFTEERSRRYEELFQKLLAQELKLEKAQEETKLAGLQKKQKKLAAIQRNIAAIQTEIVLLEAAAESDEEHLMMALLLD